MTLGGMAHMLQPGIKAWGDLRGIPLSTRERAAVLLAGHRRGMDAAALKVKEIVRRYPARECLADWRFLGDWSGHPY